MTWEINEVSDICEEDPEMVQEIQSSLKHYDESAGEILDENLVKIGEQEEMARLICWLF